MTEPTLLDCTSTLFSQGDDLIVRQSQEIPDEFISDLRARKADSINTPAGEFHLMATIPTSTIETWYRQGFDYMQAPIADILKRLKQQHLDHFIASNKSL
jgi:hypothetical protein